MTFPSDVLPALFFLIDLRLLNIAIDDRIEYNKEIYINVRVHVSSVVEDERRSAG